ncbi:LysR family transcriptional regulator [Paraburkholderia youngii]|uniref:LysR family transcriptional regulator n=1 Tax=Paraburkholderia youngii TaxID=2782701 RepID=UPI003D1B99C1
MDRVLHAMSVFTRVAQMGSFTAAADVLGITAASVSTLMRQLEARLKVTLIQRSTRSMRLTNEGVQYLDHCNRVLGEIEDMERLLNGAGDFARGCLAVDINQEVAQIILPSILEFRGRYPEVDLRIGIGGDYEGLIGNAVDCAIVVGNLSDSSLHCRQLGSLQAVTVASPDYLKRRGVPYSVDALRHHDVVHYTSKRFGTPRPLRFALDGNETSLKMPEKVCVNDAETVMRYVVAGGGIAQVSESAAGRYLGSGQLVEVLVGNRPAPLPISVLYANRRHMLMSVRVFIDWVDLQLRQNVCLREAPRKYTAGLDNARCSDWEAVRAATFERTAHHQTA